MIKRQSKEEKLDRIVDRLQHLHNRLTLYCFGSKSPFERGFSLNEQEEYRGLVEFTRTMFTRTLGITLLTSSGSLLHRFEITYMPECADDSVSFCVFTSLPYSRGKALTDLKAGFTHQVPFEIYLRQMILTSCKRDDLLTPLVACLERASNLIELEKNFID